MLTLCECLKNVKYKIFLIDGDISDRMLSLGFYENCEIIVIAENKTLRVVKCGLSKFALDKNICKKIMVK